LYVTSHVFFAHNHLQAKSVLLVKWRVERYVGNLLHGGSRHWDSLPQPPPGKRCYRLLVVHIVSTGPGEPPTLDFSVLLRQDLSEREEGVIARHTTQMVDGTVIVLSAVRT
jgi:hypothetical protein